ncbi:MAG: hypothetical protein KKB02_03915 [Alphaproteobacteria bacterium]|nr:hypothetical protein [Alphaproteobacteria bacterium]
MAIGILGAFVGLLSAIASTCVTGISIFESGVIYLVMSFATVALSAASASWPTAARSRT